MYIKLYMYQRAEHPSHTFKYRPFRIAYTYTHIKFIIFKEHANSIR